ncbi:uncharacterized protein LOC130711325 [Lotus japonicus]|uniref:uncharacterized protein LOC130711325 n=1 Tax=Lotus japonicus TaxID=34305 RepID=UPI00258E17DF|nr:uncharacterized protein LOC130711325 [Lotus japonicus]
MAELLAGAALGAVFGELLKIVSDTIPRCVNFKETLAHLSTTLTRLGPKIQEIQKLNNELGRPKEELESLLISTMRNGKQLVLQCSQTRFKYLSNLTRPYYERKLQALIKSLERFITIDLQVQMAIDQKESLHLNRKAVSLLRKFCSAKAKENATASSSHSMSTPVLEVVNESEQEEQSELLLSAPNDSMTSLEKSSTNGIDANAVTHKKKEVIVRGGFLSVTVISAENLPALDLMGKSDPFVVLTLRKAKSKAETIHKTKVVNNCLNPSWNQAFDFVVEDGLHDELIVEVWDHDTIGKDDFMGRCTLSLKRVIHEEEYEGRFKLVCAERFGAESSYLKLHLKWMHQPTHSDSNFLPSFSNDLELKPVGILKVKLMQAKELTNEHTFRKPELFVVLHMQASGEKGKESETINNDLNPIWNENFEFSVTDVSTEHLMVEVYDSNHLRSSKLIGCAEIRLSELQPGKVKYVWSKLEPLENQRDNKIRGQVHVELLYCPLDKQFAPNYSGVLSVTVISAEDLPALDLMRKSDPFVVLTLRKAKLKEEIRNTTRVVNQSLDPIWNQKFAYDVEDGLHDMVIAEVWDKDPFGKDDYIGRCILSLTKVILEGEYTESFELVGAQSGSLKLHLKWRR